MHICVLLYCLQTVYFPRLVHRVYQKKVIRIKLVNTQQVYDILLIDDDVVN
jgi:hypothetical protein